MIEAGRETNVDAEIGWGGRIPVHDRRPKEDEVAAWANLERDGRPPRYSISLEPGEAHVGPLLEAGPRTMVLREEEGREVRRVVLARPARPSTWCDYPSGISLLWAASQSSKVWRSGTYFLATAGSRAPQKSPSKSCLNWNMFPRSSAPGKPKPR